MAGVPVAVLTAALLHAIWNALAHAAADKAARTVTIGLVYTVGGGIIACFTPVPDSGAWPYLLASALLQAVYQVLLLQAYRLGDFGQMYPIARGTSPWLVALLSTFVLGQALPAGQALGVVVISAGLAGLALADGLPGRAQLPALSAALGTGVMIACYTVVDGTGVRESGTVLGYIGWMFLLQGPVLPLIALARGGKDFARRLRPAWRTGVLGGLLSLAAYGLVVGAQAFGDLATIAALRETSIVIAAVIGTLVFHERLGGRRLLASAAVLAGIAVLQLA
ncbi:EamA family transporter [Streptomyces sp. NPDC049954]|uniref:EamA family transporter n=1 Tax=Streptomyces sp. NPDC049954 TaxID=3155779 RepID=UPI00343E6040